MNLISLTPHYSRTSELLINPENLSSLEQACPEFESTVHTIVTMISGEVFHVTQCPEEIDYTITTQKQ